MTLVSRLPALTAFAALAIAAARPAAAQQTPPIMPKVQETPLPAPITLPPPPARPADVPNRPLSADEAARIALAHQPNITVAQAEIEVARGRTEQVRSGLLPTVSLSLGYTDLETLHSATSSSGGTGTGGTGTGGAGTGGTGTGGTGTGGTTVGTTTTTTTSTGVISAGWLGAAQVRQLIFDFNHVRDEVRAARQLETAASANLSRTQSDTVLAVKQAFYTYAQDERLVGVQETNVRNQQAHLAQAQALLRSGLGLPSDVVRAEAAVADAILNLNLARNAADDARVNLALQMGIDPRTPIATANTGEPAVTTNDVTGLVRTALIQRPDVRQAVATLESAGSSVSAARTTNAPNLAGTVGVSLRGPNFPPDNDFATIGVAISWDPFDGGLTAGLVREAKANQVIARAQLLGVQQTVTSDVSQAYLNLRTAEQRITTSDSEVANAQEALRLAEGRYRSGLGTFLDVTDAQTALVTAQTNRVNAQSAVDQARAALAHSTGAPLP